MQASRFKLGYRILCVASVGAGSLGLLLPLVPTTPFLLLALWAAARGAPEWHGRIRNHPRFVSTLDAWEYERAIPPRAKYLGCALLASSWLMLWASGAGPVLLASLAAFFVGFSIFLLSRPSPSGKVSLAAQDYPEIGAVRTRTSEPPETSSQSSAE